jgi:hypothetical protein
MTTLTLELAPFDSPRLRVVKPFSSPQRGFHSPRPTGGVQEQLIQLRRGVAAFRERNAHLQASIDHLTFSDYQSQKHITTGDFAQDLDCLRRRLELRQANLLELERQVTLFRPEEVPVVPPPNRHALRMPSPRKFVLSLDDITQQKAHIKRVHTDLTNQALANERLIILTRMRLHLAHDHRDLTTLRRRLERLFVDSEDEEGAAARVRQLKAQCRTVSAAIKTEKDRIRQENWICADEYFAAVAIQSAWRGCAFRRYLLAIGI